MWSLWFPELRHYPSVNDRRDVMRRWEARRRLPSQWLLLFLAMFVVSPVLSYPLMVLADRYRLIGILVWLAMVGSIGFAVRVIYFRIGGGRFRAFIRNDLLSQQICWRCGYDLTGNETGCCSECGLTGVHIIAKY